MIWGENINGAAIGFWAQIIPTLYYKRNEELSQIRVWIACFFGLIQQY
jgi:hypothetical protein